MVYLLLLLDDNGGEKDDSNIYYEISEEKTVKKLIRKVWKDDSSETESEYKACLTWTFITLRKKMQLP